MTLVELLVVLAVIGLVIGIGVPALLNYGQQVRLKTTARQLMGLILFARQRAIASRAEHAVVVDLEARKVTVVDLGSGEVQEQRLDLPSSISIDVQVGGESMQEPQLVFRPTGSMKGRTTTVVLANTERQHTITALAATGAVFIE